MRIRYVSFVILALTILIFSTAFVSTPVSALPDAPLSVYVKEYVNATMEADGMGVRCDDWNVTGFIEVKNNADESVYDIWFPVKPTDRVSLDSSPAYATVVKEVPPSWVTDTYPSSGFGSASEYEWWHITELHPGDSVVFRYEVTTFTGCPPISVSETYSPVKIVDGQASTVSINLTLTNGFDGDVQVKVKKVLSPDNTAGDGWYDTTSNPVFSSEGTPSSGSTSLSADSKTLYWTGDGSWPGTYITIASGDSITFTTPFQVQGTPDLGEVGGTTQKVELGRVYVYFTIDEPVTDTRVGYVYAIGKSSLEVKKEQDTTNPSTWYETMVVYDTSGVFDYEVLNTTMWATQGNTPDSTLVTGSRNTQQGSPLATIGPGEGSTSYTYGPSSFSYDLVPKVWALFKARIQRDETYGWMNYTNTTVFETGDETNYTVVEKIWVVKGYLVKARKEVRPGATSGEYCIGIRLENIGEWMTPYVEFYDLVPSGFQPNPSATEGDMVFYPLSMLAQDANPSSPPDYSLITSPSGYTKGYVWKVYPLPVQRGFAVWFPDTSTTKTITVTMKDGSTRDWGVQVVDADTVRINSTDYAEGTEFLADSSDDNADTYFKVVLVQDSLSTGGGYVVVSAKGHYDNMDIDVYNPVFVHYCVLGSGDYNVTDIFVVGVDPRNTLDVNSVFMPFTGLNLASYNFEPWLVLAVVGLLTAEILFELRMRARRRARSLPGPSP